MGILVLLGIVLNNAIVLVDHINQCRDRGLNLLRAVIQGTQDRLRPILITSATAILDFAHGPGTAGRLAALEPSGLDGHWRFGQCHFLNPLYHSGSLSLDHAVRAKEGGLGR